MISPQEIKAKPRLGRIHNCSDCPNFNVFNRGLCFTSCKMGQDRVAHWKLISRAEVSESQKKGMN